MVHMRRLAGLTVVLALVMALVLSPGGAYADEGPGSPVVVGGNAGRTTYQATVRTDSQGVWVEIHADRSTDGVSSPGIGAGTTGSTSNTGTTKAAGSSGGSTASTIVRSWYDPSRGYFSQTADGTIFAFEGVNLGQAAMGPSGWYTIGIRQHPNSTPYAFSVNGVYQHIVWIPINTPSVSVNVSTTTGMAGSQSVQVDPKSLALDILKHVPLPNAQLRANPGLGLVALPAWFWVEGYDGKPFGASQAVDIPPEVGAETPVSVVPQGDPRRVATSVVVEVQVQPSRYEWSFGDGKTLVTQSLGQPYPEESDVKHTYQYSSLRFPSGFPLKLTVEFSVEYQVNGGPPQVLPPITRTYEATYQVQEIQPVLTHP